MVKEVDDIDETPAKRVAGGSHACLPKVESPFRWLAVVGDPYGDSLSIHQRKPSS
jgi:predicted enzyme related to lactoylglutathione lyase